MTTFVTVVLDGVGVGAQPDADRYGDAGSHTLGHVCRAARPDLPNLQRLGLGCVADLEGVPPAHEPQAHTGRMREVSAGKDSTTGHWELAGLRLHDPFPTYPDSFPPDVIDAFVAKTGCGGVLGNKPESGTVIIEELGERHAETGRPIVYTSADSVFQIAAHKDVIALHDLYRLCRIAREDVCTGKHGVGRVIARPFVGSPGAYERISAERRDFARKPKRRTLQEALQQAGVTTVAVGKISDLFAGVGFDEAIKTKNNDDGVRKTLDQMRAKNDEPAFIWTNLVDFDEQYGHRGDADGFARALEAFDRAVPDLLDALPDGGRLVITADHGNDPTTPSTDHSREHVPLLYVDDETPGRDLGLRSTFADHAATVARYFDAPMETNGRAFSDK